MKFEARLRTFVNSTKTAMKAALDCANMSIAHFEEHGDLSYAQKFFDAMPKNYVRRMAFVQWLAAFSPVTMEKGKFIKDKHEDAVEFNVKIAHSQSFWDYAPDPEEIHWGKADLVAQVKSLITRYKGDRYVANDDQSEEALGKLENLVVNL